MIAGIFFGLQGVYDTIFVVFMVLALACSLLVLKAKPPARSKPLPAGSNVK